MRYEAFALSIFLIDIATFKGGASLKDYTKNQIVGIFLCD